MGVAEAGLRPAVSESIGGVPGSKWDVATAATAALADLGVSWAFGVSGGGISRIWRALLDGPVQTVHCRSEAGAAFAAIEASLALDAPTAVFATTGPGITSTLTGLVAARAERAHVVLLSGRTSPGQRGRGAVQETPGLLPSADFFTRGWLFDDVFWLDDRDELPQVLLGMARGFSRPGPYLAHLSIPVCVQSAPVVTEMPVPPRQFRPRVHPDPAAVEEVIAAMRQAPFAIWAGRGACRAARQVRDLAELTGAPVLCTPRGRGVLPEDHPQFTMVTGLGGHPDGVGQLRRHGVRWMLVLGTRLTEPSSGWDSALVPPGGFVQVDLDPPQIGFGLDRPCKAIVAEVGAFVDEVLAGDADLPRRTFTAARPFPAFPAFRAASGSVRPQALMAAVQRRVIDAGLPVLVEPGSSMAWATHWLRINRPGQLRIVGLFGSMCQMTCGVLGAAVARGRAVCLTGDGSMLMGNELSTAAHYRAPAVWVVLNDGKYAMCEKGAGFAPHEDHARFPQCDFAQVARAMGVAAERVTDESGLQPALERALQSEGPYVVDVLVDPAETAPFASRLRTLA